MLYKTRTNYLTLICGLHTNGLSGEVTINKRVENYMKADVHISVAVASKVESMD